MKGGDLKCVDVSQGVVVAASKAAVVAPGVVVVRPVRCVSASAGSLMQCEAPFVMNGKAFACGKCQPCQFNKRRLWSHRIVLESHLHADNAFLTLTYADENLPVLPNGRPTLVPKHAQDWLKRIRKAVEPTKLRYFLVGEYGDETQRPHYHVALFGYPTCRHLQTRPRLSCCAQCDLVRDTWGHGRVFLGTLEPHSAGYISGYVTKKMTRRDDPRLDGRDPEFARMSLKPGIGADFMHEVASTELQFNLVQRQGDVSSSLRHGSKTWPLGRYLTKKLRTFQGLDEKAPQIVLDKIKEDLRPVQEAAFNASSSFAEAIKNSRAAKVSSFKARQKIYKGKRSL